MNAVSYPRLIKRVRAVLIDSVVVPVVTVAVVILGTLLKRHKIEYDPF